MTYSKISQSTLHALNVYARHAGVTLQTAAKEILAQHQLRHKGLVRHEGGR